MGAVEEYMIKKGVPIIIDEKGNVITWDYFDSSDKWYLPKETKKVEYFDRKPIGYIPKDWQGVFK